MDRTYEKKSNGVVFVEPVKIEDCPMPLHIRAWEAVKMAAFGVRRQIRRSDLLKKAVWAAIALLALAGAPVLLIVMLMSMVGKGCRRTGVAF